MQRDKAVEPTNQAPRRTARPWFGGRRRTTVASAGDRAQPGADNAPASLACHGADVVGEALDVAGVLDVSVSVDRADTAIVTVAGRLIRQNAEALDRSLGSVFAADHPTYVIDLAGVTRLDPTTLAAITRRAALARGRGARITIVPPGARRDRAA